MIFSHGTRLFLALCLLIGGPLSLNAQYVAQRAGQQLKQSFRAASNVLKRPGARARKNMQIRSYSTNVPPKKPSVMVDETLGTTETVINAPFKKFAQEAGTNTSFKELAQQAETSVVNVLKNKIDTSTNIWDYVEKRSDFFKKIIQEMRTKSWQEWAEKQGFNFFESNKLLDQLQIDLQNIPRDALKRAHEIYIQNIRDLYKESYATLAFIGKKIEEFAEKELKELGLQGTKYDEKVAQVKQLIQESLEEFNTRVKLFYKDGLKDIAYKHRESIVADRLMEKLITQENPLSRMRLSYDIYESKLKHIYSDIKNIFEGIRIKAASDKASSDRIKASLDSIKSPSSEWREHVPAILAGAGMATVMTGLPVATEKLAHYETLLKYGTFKQKTLFDKQLRYDEIVPEPKNKRKLTDQKIALAESYITGSITAYDSSSGEYDVLPAEVDLNRAQALIDEVSQNNPNDQEITAIVTRLTEAISQEKIQKALYNKKIDQLGGRLIEHMA